MRRLRLFLLTLLIAPSLSGCLAIGAAALVTDVAVGTAGTVVGTAGKVGGAAVGAVLPGGNDDEDED
ncbi:hypothetical protein [Maricaulis sp.]|uniref:hypothetical protein n=1 Tax=unclassified Maricaulis TaxID=2632371 RepID=UPI001B0FC228|nr:hypothetical protein [Maricaulis sp.]MBO6797324.1 hypothetical protein [Maricaulis sp.]